MNTKCLVRILKELQPTKSGITYEFDRSSQEIILKSPHKRIYHNSDKLFETSQKAGMTYEDFSDCMTYQEYERWMIKETTALMEEKHIGGVGITSRTLAETEEVMPGITKILGAERGKIAFIGNGFSTAVLGFTSISSLVRLETIPLIVDMFDYKAALIDITELHNKFRKSRIIDEKIEIHLSRIQELVSSIDDERVLPVKYFFGSRRMPSKLMDCSAVVNCFGPSVTTLDEQLGMLRVGGKLYSSTTSYDESRILCNHMEFTQRIIPDMTVYERVR